jgi:hypothetical protein
MKNTIKAICKTDGSCCSTDEEMRALARSFYADLYASKGINFFNAILISVEQMVYEDMNSKLLVPFSNEEIEQALFQMGPTKAPGPDGLPALFYQCNWALVKGEVFSDVRDFLVGGNIPDNFSDIIIVLIPKVCTPENSFSSYKPL